jgi:hypothetical protein
MNYRMIERQWDNLKVFCIYETRTEQIIYANTTKNSVRKLMRKLNLGGGFDGWSPTFFAIKETK